MHFTILKISSDTDKLANEEFNDQTTLVSAQDTSSSSSASPLATKPAFSYKAFFARPRVLCGLVCVLAGLSLLSVCLYPFSESSRKRMDVVLDDIYRSAQYEANGGHYNNYSIAVLRTSHTATGCVHHRKQVSCKLVEAYRGSCWNPWGAFNVEIYYGYEGKLDCRIVRTGDGGFINWVWGGFKYTRLSDPEGAIVEIDGPRWPDGPWQDSCEKVFYDSAWSKDTMADGIIVSSVCKDGSGIKHNSTVDISPCKDGPLFNYNGQIACSASGPPLKSFESGRNVVFPDL